jgi:hypothetical protein
MSSDKKITVASRERPFQRPCGKVARKLSSMWRVDVPKIASAQGKDRGLN